MKQAKHSAPPRARSRNIAPRRKKRRAKHSAPPRVRSRNLAPRRQKCRARHAAPPRALSRQIFWAALTLVILLLVLAFVFAQSQTTPQTQDGSITTADSVADDSTVVATATPTPTLSPDATTAERYADAKVQNSDTMGWLTVTGTDIDNPLMQSTNNTDYLSLNELGQYDGWGSYFADYYANLTSAENLVQNTVVYGHSENPENPDGVKFSQLYRYLEQDFLEENPYLYLTIGTGDDVQTLTFEIFAVFFTDIDFYYIDPAPSSTDFDTFLSTVQAGNVYDDLFEDDSITEADKLLTLSTCSHRYDTANTGDWRFVIMAKLVSSAP